MLCELDASIQINRFDLIGTDAETEHILIWFKWIHFFYI